MYPDITEEQNWNGLVFEFYTGFHLTDLWLDPKVVTTYEVICTQTSETDTMKAIESGAEKVTSVRRQLN